MANKRISALDDITVVGGTSTAEVNANDILPITDVDDTTGSPQGTTKGVTVANLMAASPVQSVAGQTGAVTIANTDVSGLGTAATKNVGTSNGNVVELDTTGLPAVDGSQLTNLPRPSSEIVAESTTTRTLSDSDNGKVIVCSNSSEVTITLPNTLTAGFGCTVIQSGTGQVTIVAGAGSTLSSYAGTSTKGRYATLQIIPIGTNAYIVDGEGLFPPGAFESNIYAVSLDGTDDYAAPNHTFQSLIQSDFSMSMWVKLANTTGNQWLIGGENGSFADRFNLYHDSNKVTAYLKSNGVQSATVSTSTGITWTDWFHIVLTFSQNGTSVDNAIYANGTSSTGTTANMSLADYGTGSSPRNLAIGALMRASASSYLEGEIDEVAFFNYKLTTAQVTNIYKGETDSGSGGTSGVPGSLTTFNPQHWWRMGDNDSATGGGTPSSVTDKGGAATTYDLSFPNGATSYDLSTSSDSIHVAP
jgi:hypothetical protein